MFPYNGPMPTGHPGKTIVAAKCVGCGIDFSVPLKSPNRPPPKYCSRECFKQNGIGKMREKGYAALAKKWNSIEGHKKPRTQYCEICGEIIDCKPCRKRRFCSRACALVGRYLYPPPPDIYSDESQCQQCGTLIIAPYWKNRQFCGRKCASLFSGEKRKKPKSHACIQCGKLIEYYPSNNRRFCSHECVSTWKASHPEIYKKPRTRNCKWCGKIIDIRPSIERKFCSPECATNSWKGVSRIDGTPPAKTLLWQRKFARAKYNNACSRCGYNDVPEILQVHHRDHNPRNHAEDNLELLCPNCHEADHFQTKTGRFGNHTRKKKENREDTYKFKRRYLNA